MNKRFGFTLAEVLITLGIIGVVAALTIPNLMKVTTGQEFRSAFKEAYSALNRAVKTNLSITANADFSTLGAGDFATDDSIANMFKERLAVVKTTDVEDAPLETAATVTVSSASNYTFFLNSGVTLGFPQAAQYCTQGTWIANSCAAVVDINGVKGPNKLTNCDSASATVDNAVCTKDTLLFGDRFSIRFVEQQVEPNGNAVRALLVNMTALER